MLAIQQIVDAYVRLGDRQHLEDLLNHRQRIAVNAKGKDSLAFSRLAGQVDEEIAVVLDGLRRLDSASKTDSAEQGDPTQ